MSKAYLTLKNFRWSEMVNIMCYGAKYPETLSQTQRITRLYRATIRRSYTTGLEDFRPNHQRFYDNLHKTSKDFYRLMELNNNYANLSQAEKVEFETLEQKWVKWHEDNYDAFLFVEECRAYAPSSCKYYVYSDEELAHDPLGYYKSRLVSDGQNDKHLPYFKDYPYNETHWYAPESFPAEFNDEPTERKPQQ